VSVHLLVIAKEPYPGISKTRLCPPCSPQQAAAAARAAIDDTLAAALVTQALSHTLVLDGRPGDWVHSHFDVIHQRGAGLARRLDAAFEDCSAPALLIGMDTPQVTPDLLEAAGSQLIKPGVDAVLGPSDDGGYWAIGLQTKCEGVFDGVPMSSTRTAAAQCHRLDELGLTYELLPPLRDVDYWEDALAVAESLPDSRFGRAVARIEQNLMEATA
jgi:uncharacterized protein